LATIRWSMLVGFGQGDRWQASGSLPSIERVRPNASQAISLSMPVCSPSQVWCLSYSAVCGSIGGTWPSERGVGIWSDPARRLLRTSWPERILDPERRQDGGLIRPQVDRFSDDGARQVVMSPPGQFDGARDGAMVGQNQDFFAGSA
jgi:hypothetical protein